MKTAILQELASLEQEHKIKILYAVESGSRAWGFASTNSDWDVRYIYIHHPDWYLSIDEKKDSQEKILSNDIDLAGWELRKALRLFRKSNPPMLEWLRSPTIYSENYTTATQLRELTKTYFNPKSCLHHYLHMAEGNYKDYLQRDLVRVKKYFYVLRPILACEWIKHTNTMAPMEFQHLVESQVHDSLVKKEIAQLLAKKIMGEELNEGPRIDLLNTFIDERISYYNEYVKTLGTYMQPDTDKLNSLFKLTLDEAWSL
jgi:uncharacterized protein